MPAKSRSALVRVAAGLLLLTVLPCFVSAKQPAVAPHRSVSSAPAQPPSAQRNFQIRITEYYLSVYPVETSPASPSQVLAYMTLIGVPVDTNTPTANFYIQFYADHTAGLSGPGVNTGGTGAPQVIVDMYYSQLAGLVKKLDDSISKEGPACFMSYTDGPPIHAEFFVDIAKSKGRRRDRE